MGSCCGASQEAKAAARAQGVWERLEAVCEKFESTPSLIVSALGLVASFLLVGHGCDVSGGAATSAAEGWHRWAEIFNPAWVPLVLCGLPVLKEAVEALVVERRIRAALLITSAMVACVCIGQLFAAGEVAFIMALGEKLEDWTVNRAKKGLHKLVALVPQTAHKVVTCPKCNAKGIFFKDVPVAELAVGDPIEVLPGMAVPADGEVYEGETTVDQASLTGESLPVAKKAGDEVYSGTINQRGTIRVRVTKPASDSSVQKLVRLVQEAEAKKAPMQRIADKWAAILVPCSMTVAILAFAGIWLALGDAHEALLRAVTILVVFCPCALALATPTSVMAAIGQATKFGVIVKSGEALEKMGRVTFACFDKTGTLQLGDALRPGAKETIADLKALGVKSLMLSGDRADIARKFAAEAGIDEVRSECRPEDKSKMVEELQARGERVVMVGDGVNDSIALKVADVGVAMGGIGTDIAQEAADVSLVTDDITKLAYLKRLSVGCVKLIKLNIAISMTINAGAIVCSILGVLGPVSGALVHNLGSVLVILNGALLYDRKYTVAAK